MLKSVEGSNTNKRTARRTTAYYALMQMTYWMGNGCVVGYAAVFMNARGFSGVGIGLVLAVGMIASILLQNVLGGVIDKRGRGTLKLFTVADVSLCLLLAGVLLVPGLPMAATAVIFGLLVAVSNTIQPLLNSICFRYVNGGVNVNYGIARGLGSLAYAVIVYILGLFVVESNVSVLIIAAACTFAVLIALALLLPRSMEAGEPEKKSGAAGGIGALFTKNKRLFLFAGGTVLLIFCLLGTETYYLQIFQRLGGGTKEVGTALSLAAVLEIPGMLLFSRIVKKISVKKCLWVSAIFFVVKAVIIALAGSVAAIYAAQAVQMVAYAIYMPSIVYYVNDEAGEQFRATGQALMASAVTAGGVLASLVGGVIIDSFGALTLTVVCAIAGVVGAFIVIAATGSKPKRQAE